MGGSGIVTQDLAENVSGPLPVDVPFTKTQDGTVLLVTVSGTAFANAGGSGELGISIDSGGRFALSDLYFNNTGEHLTFPEMQSEVTGFQAGSHTLHIASFGNAITDTSDSYHVSIIEVRNA
jgi:hypothetical protein